ncbi:phage tail protein [Paenibacillus psychroresistens]|uniref:Phage tail protein n=1 Tax=Paenibacillus psychroresistens TaxID=1778678 RepID=A0A6B8RM11_9BACL|nr:phage major tail tube protein [Paenibacillus psychroresistens]QGQ97059.1 phage tail protein [Paenibacillus psychroresistens]
MPKITNKTIQYKLKASNQANAMVLIDDSSDLQLPSIEKLTDTVKGSGIMGEIDLPSFGQLGSMTFAVNNRADNAQYAIMSRPGEIKFEIIWVVDVFDSSQVKVGIQQHKVFLSGVSKKYDMGKIDVNSGADGSSEFEIYYLRKIVDGKEVLLIDKFNFKYVVNGTDYMNDLRTALQ